MIKTPTKLLMTAVFTTSILNGCSSIDSVVKSERAGKADSDEQFTQSTVAARLNHAQSELESTKQSLSIKDRELSSLQTERDQALKALAQSKAQLAVADVTGLDGSSQSTQTVSGENEQALPPMAKPGQCFARVWQDAVYKEATKQVLVQPEQTRIEAIPATYRTVKKQVLVADETERLEVVPAKYDWVEERVEVVPATKKFVTVSATYETVAEKILVKPAHTQWKKGRGLVEKLDQATGEILCLVEVPAEYKTVSTKALKTPETVKEVVNPATYKMVKKRVMVMPPSTRKIAIPAEYKIVEVKEESRPESKHEATIPAKYTTVTQRELVSDGTMEWRSVLCETNMTKERIASLQDALIRKGFNPGPVDGLIGMSTIRAVNAFQREEGLPVDRHLNIATIEALAVNAR